MNGFKEYYNTKDPKELGYYALLVSVCKKKSADESMRIMKIKPWGATWDAKRGEWV